MRRRLEAVRAPRGRTSKPATAAPPTSEAPLVCLVGAVLRRRLEAVRAPRARTSKPATAAPPTSEAPLACLVGTRHRLEQLPGDGAVGLDERAELPGREPVA